MAHECKPECVADWSPSRKCHCSGCGQNFSTPSNFDKHKPGECLQPDKCGLIQNVRGIWQQPGEVDIRDRFK